MTNKQLSLVSAFVGVLIGIIVLNMFMLFSLSKSVKQNAVDISKLEAQMGVAGVVMNHDALLKQIVQVLGSQQQVNQMPQSLPEVTE